MPDILLPTKLLIPFSRPELVTRRRLIDELEQGTYRTLTLISAPAGFGKTTLAAEWIDQLRQEESRDREVRAAWLSLDESDNDFQRFLTYFLAALVQMDVIDPECERSVTEMLRSQNPPPVESIFSPLLASLSATKKKIIIVLDDYHLIEDIPIHKALNFWLEKTPPQVHTVILTREDPPFPLARMRAKDLLTELRAADLRFTASEAAQFLNEVMKLGLDAPSAAALGERTEGWIAGLQMAALSMRDRKDTASFIRNFSGTNRYILDYLLEEVLANQTPDIQEFLLQTSILKQLTGPLCDQLLGGDPVSASLLRSLDEANLFLIPLDDQRSWYRYHHLFSDLLRARLGQTRSAEEIAELHRRAARWYEEQGLSFGAIYHASLIPDDEWVERIIDQNYMEIFQRQDSALIRNWTGELSRELIFKRPRLAIHEANSRAWFGQLDQADHLLDQAEKRLDALEKSAEVKAMRGYLAYIRSRVTAMRGNFTRAIELSLQARENTPASNPGLLGGIGVMLGYGYFLAGDFSLAEETLNWTIQSGKESGAINTTIGAICVLARLYALQGQLHRSHDLYQEGVDFIQGSAGEHRGAMSILDVGLAEVHYEWNSLDEAFDRIRSGLEHLHLWSKADDFALAYIIQSQIQRALGRIPEADQSIERAARVTQSSGVFPEARGAVLAAELEAILSKGDSLAADRWEKSAESRWETDRPCRFKNELVLLALARARMARKDFTQALELLSRLEHAAETEGRNGRLLKILILQASALDQSGDPGSALPILERALALAEPERFTRAFVDQGPEMGRLLRRWSSEYVSHPLSGYARQLIAAFEDEPKADPGGPAQPAGQEKLIEQLTKRELEVLTLIASGKTNKDISAELVVSPGTVKAHTSNIYRKLDVSNRTEAVARARELGILP